MVKAKKPEAISSRITYLKSNIEKQLTGFKQRREKNRKYATTLKVLNSIFGVIVTVLLGLQISQVQQNLNNIALVISALMTILITIDGFFNYRQLWIRYTITTNELHSLKSDLDYATSDGTDVIDPNRLDEFYKRYSDILEKTNQDWADIRADRKTT